MIRETGGFSASLPSPVVQAALAVTVGYTTWRLWSWYQDCNPSKSCDCCAPASQGAPKCPTTIRGSSIVSNPVDQVVGNTAAFISRVVDGLQEEHRLNVRQYELDHVCFRCVDTAEYLRVRKALQMYGKIIIESMIGGRPISVIDLDAPIRAVGFTVRCVELACPKPGRSHTRGLEHAEFVVGVHPEAFAQSHPSVGWDRKAVNKEENPDVCVTVAGNLSAKFHEDSLYNVAKREVSTNKSVPVPADYFTTR